ncbi:hypothetical protein UlMin_032997 [Ulmus minor]
MEGSPTTIGPVLLRNLAASIFIYADKSFLGLSKKYKLLQLVRYLLISAFLFILRLIPSFSFFPSLNEISDFFYPLKPTKIDPSYLPSSFDGGGGGGDSAIARALGQLLSIANDIPVSSRKYQVVRSLAEKIIEDNRREGNVTLREVNRTALSAAFARTLSQVEAALVEQGCPGRVVDGNSAGPADYRLNRVLRAARSIRHVVWKEKEGVSRSGRSAEKLAAELLWVAEKMEACGFSEEAVWSWATASNLASLAVSAEPRLQCSLVGLSAFLFKQAKDMGVNEEDESKKEQTKQMKMQMLQSWLPLLCRASNGTDVPVLSIGEKVELERVLEETIEMLEEEEDQEKVLSLWLHHFTYCSSSDWPNLHASYAKWCVAARKLLLHQ